MGLGNIGRMMMLLMLFAAVPFTTAAQSSNPSPALQDVFLVLGKSDADSAGMLFVVAKEKGFFSAEGINFVVGAEHDLDADTKISELESGDIFFMGRARVYQIESTRPGLMKIFNVNTQDETNWNDSILIRKDFNLSSLSRLDAKEPFGLLGGGPARGPLVKLLLEKNNLKVQEFRLVNLPGTIQMYTEKAPAQFLTGINILYAREPFLSLLLAQGDWRTFIDEPLFAKNILSPWPMTMTLFSTKFLKEKPLLAKKVIDAYDKAMLFIKEHPQEASYIFSKYLEERYGVKLNLRKVNHLRYSQVSKELIQRQSDWYFDNKLIPSKIKATDLFFDESMLGP